MPQFDESYHIDIEDERMSHCQRITLEGANVSAESRPHGGFDPPTRPNVPPCIGWRK